MVQPLQHRFSIALASFVCLLGAVTAANATTFSLGTLSNGTTSFAASHASAFTDRWNFSLVGLDNISATVSAIGLKGLSMDLFSYTFNKKGKEKDTLIVTGTTFTFADLASGDYFLQIKGSPSKKNKLGSYTGTITIAAVPEPEVWAMMLVGVGLVGHQIRRKSKAGPVKIVA